LTIDQRASAGVSRMVGGSAGGRPSAARETAERADLTAGADRAFLAHNCGRRYETARGADG
jgi:hypothetical protein